MALKDTQLLGGTTGLDLHGYKWTKWKSKESIRRKTENEPCPAHDLMSMAEI